ncbi:MAG: hypothetical protein KKB50_08865 [Planctomycetes bacterium]|nr:hypothetical protein [Planctomycetota bacterium]
MTKEELQQLLREADHASGPPPLLPENLAQRVRARAARRQPLNAVGAAAVAAAILLALGLPLLQRQATTPPSAGTPPAVATHELSPTEVARIREEISELRREADLRLAVLRRTQESEAQFRRAREMRQRPMPPDAVALARKEIARAAFVIVQQADRMQRTPNQREPAIAKYRQVAELFPQTAWAAVARQRLERINANEGEV